MVAVWMMYNDNVLQRGSVAVVGPEKEIGEQLIPSVVRALDHWSHHSACDQWVTDSHLVTCIRMFVVIGLLLHYSCQKFTPEASSTFLLKTIILDLSAFTYETSALTGSDGSGHG